MAPLSFIFFSVLCAGAATFVGALIPFLVRKARRNAWVDLPDGDRKNHARPTPPVGGLVMIPTFMMLLPSLGFSVAGHWPLFGALGLLVAVGFIDDFFGMKAAYKFLAQLAAALLLAATGEAVINHFGHLFGVDKIVGLEFLSIPFSVVCIIFLINAVNMMDGLDGLAGGVTLMMGVWLGVAAILSGNTAFAAVCGVFVAILSGFLVHNMRYPGHKRATVFMGDTGSMCLGVIIAWLGINISMAPGATLTPIGVAMIILIPIMDAFALFVARKKNGLAAFTPGHDHLHHRLRAAGLDVSHVTMTLICLVGATGIIGVVGPSTGLGEGLLTWIWIAAVLGHTFLLLARSRALYQKGD